MILKLTSPAPTVWNSALADKLTQEGKSLQGHLLELNRQAGFRAGLWRQNECRADIVVQMLEIIIVVNRLRTLPRISACWTVRIEIAVT